MLQATSHKLRFVIFHFFTVLFLFTLPTRVFAQETFGLTVSPPTFEISANPGDSITNTIRIDNLSNQVTDVEVDIRDFVAVGEEGSVDLVDEETFYTLSNWIKVYPEKVTLSPQEMTQFTFVITLPPDVEPGGHFGSIVFKPQVRRDIENTGAIISQELGALILLNVAGDVQREMKVASFTSEKNFYEFGPVNFETRFENTGNVHMKTGGTIIVSNMLNQIIAEIPITSKNVLPKAVRKTSESLEKQWLFGSYRAVLVYNYGNNQVLTAQTQFTVIPYKHIAVGTILVGFVMFILYKKRKNILLAVKIIFSNKTPEM